MKTLFKSASILLLIITIVMLLHRNQELEGRLSSVPEVQEMIRDRDYKFLNVFESNGHRFALVAKMKNEDGHYPPMLIRVGNEFPLTGSGFEQTIGFQNQAGEIKTLW